jgi:hypothetical protein
LTLEERVSLDEFMGKLVEETRKHFFEDFPEYTPKVKPGSTKAELVERIKNLVRTSPRPMTAATVISHLELTGPVNHQAVRTLLAVHSKSEPGNPALWRRIVRGVYWRNAP